MTSANLKSLLIKGIAEDLSYLELRVHLIDFKEQGGEQSQALTVLEEIHKTVSDETVGDRLLELMDLTEGLGIKALKVW